MIKLDVTDKLATLSFSPADADARPLSVDRIVEKLTQAGVCCGILHEEIARLAEQQSEGARAVEGVPVARWIEPQAGRPAAINVILSDDQIAAAGDVIAQVGEPVAAVDGKTIFGAPVKANGPTETVLRPGANTRLIGARKLVATIYGKVSHSDEQIAVEPLVSVNDDRLTAFMSIHHKSSAGTPITVDMVRDSLQVAGIVYGVNEGKIQAALKQSLENDSALPDQIVAEGRPSIRGEDAHLEFFEQMQQAIGQQRDDGSMNFRERGTIRNFKSGVMICRRIPLTRGRSKVDVYGLGEFATPGEDKVFLAGENVEKRDEEFWSMIDGAAIIRDNVVTVSDVYVVSGDIDLGTGNLRHEKGALQIKGTVRSGFKVYADTHIMVGALVEDATLECGGDIEINGGVIHAANGSLRAKGNVTAKFAQNAKISAGGDITIHGAAMNCELYAGSRIVVTGNKARLAGGIAHAVGGFRVEQLGSELAAPTRIEIDSDREPIQSKESQLDSSNSAHIIVDGSVYPGVTVRIGTAHHTFTEVSRHCKIWLAEDGEIHVSPLR